MRSLKEKRRGGARDESEIYIGYSQQQLCDMLRDIKCKCALYIKLYQRNRTPYERSRCECRYDLSELQWRRHK